MQTSSELSEATIRCLDYRVGEKASMRRTLPVKPDVAGNWFVLARRLARSTLVRAVAVYSSGRARRIVGFGVAALMGWERATQGGTIALFAGRNWRLDC